MAFFEKLQEVAKTIGEKTTETMKVVGDKTSDAVEITKQKAKISSEKSAIADVKKQIGELVWSKFEAGETVSEDLAEYCNSIQVHLDTIAKCEADIEAVKNNGKTSAEAQEEAEEAAAEAELAEENAEEAKTEAAVDNAEETSSEEIVSEEQSAE